MSVILVIRGQFESAIKFELPTAGNGRVINRPANSHIAQLAERPILVRKVSGSNPDVAAVNLVSILVKLIKAPGRLFRAFFSLTKQKNTMPNRPTARFHNTLNDLQDCLDALRDIRHIEHLPESQQEDAKALIALCLEVVEEFGEE